MGKENLQTVSRFLSGIYSRNYWPLFWFIRFAIIVNYFLVHRMKVDVFLIFLFFTQICVLVKKILINTSLKFKLSQDEAAKRREQRRREREARRAERDAEDAADEEKRKKEREERRRKRDNTGTSLLYYIQLACSTDKTKLWLSLSVILILGPHLCTRIQVCCRDWPVKNHCLCRFANQGERKLEMLFL